MLGQTLKKWLTSCNDFFFFFFVLGGKYKVQWLDKLLECDIFI